MVKLIAENINVSYPQLPVLADVSITAESGSFISILGPSGCGKSTFLEVLARLITPGGGSLVFEGEGPDNPVAYLPQRDLLFPWRKLKENLLLGPEIAGEDLESAWEEAKGLLPLFGLEGFEGAYPGELSGGMRQRAALLRTILCHKPILALDEPFGALDAITRRQMQNWLLDIFTRFGHTIIFVTHDVEEALLLSDRIYLLTQRPAHVLLELEIEQKRPRDPGSQQLLTYREQLLSHLEASHG